MCLSYLVISCPLAKTKLHSMSRIPGRWTGREPGRRSRKTSFRKWRRWRSRRLARASFTTHSWQCWQSQGLNGRRVELQTDADVQIRACVIHESEHVPVNYAMLKVENYCRRWSAVFHLPYWQQRLKMKRWKIDCPQYSTLIIPKDAVLQGNSCHIGLPQRMYCFMVCTCSA